MSLPAYVAFFDSASALRMHGEELIFAMVFGDDAITSSVTDNVDGLAVLSRYLETNLTLFSSAP